MTDEQIIQSLKARNMKLHRDKLEIESDIRNTIQILYGIKEALGIGKDDLLASKTSTDDKVKEGMNLSSSLPSIISKIGIKLATNRESINNEFSKLAGLSPIMLKYEYLIEDLIPKNDE